MPVSIDGYLQDIEPNKPRKPSPIKNAIAAIRDWINNGVPPADLQTGIPSSKLAGAKTTRRIHLPMGGWVVGTAGAFAIHSGQNRIFQMDDTVQSFMLTSFIVPKDWDGTSNFTIKIRLMDGTVAANGYITALADCWKTGEAASTPLNSAQAVAMGNTNNTQRETSFTLTAASVDPDDHIGLRVGRLADNALDTCNGTPLFILEVFVEYGSTI